MLAVDQLIVVVIAAAVSVIVAIADHNVKPGLGSAVMVERQPLGVGVNVPLDHVYVEVPLGPAGVVKSHL